MVNQEECRSRLGEGAGRVLWELCNAAFDLLPLGAVIEGRVLVVHGGLGQSFTQLGRRGGREAQEMIVLEGMVGEADCYGVNG